MSVGYLVSSHVMQCHIAVPILLRSMLECGIEPCQIFVIVNGSTTEHDMTCNGIRYLFRVPNDYHHLIYVANESLGERYGITHWFFVNCTSRCGPRFKHLVENGFDADADATCASGMMLGSLKNRPINDLAMYADAFLVRIKGDIQHLRCAGWEAINKHEGFVYSIAERKAVYADSIRMVLGEAKDAYGTGTLRITEYFPSIDWCRFKKNYGQLDPDTFDPAIL